MKRLALIGNKIQNTLSPKVHALIAKQLNEELYYEVLDFEPSELKKKIEYLRQEFDGFNVTKPYKGAVCQYLNEVNVPQSMCDTKNQNSDFRCVNTVTIKDGQLCGYNTDIAAFYSETESFSLKGDSVLVLGTGGAASAILCSLGIIGAKAYVWGRSAQKASNLAKAFNAKVFDSSVYYRAVINCASEDVSVPEFDKTFLDLLFSLNYNCSNQKFFSAATLTCAQTRDGLAMLILQAIYGAIILYDKNLTPKQITAIFNEMGV